MQICRVKKLLNLRNKNLKIKVQSTFYKQTKARTCFGFNDIEYFLLLWLSFFLAPHEVRGDREADAFAFRFVTISKIDPIVGRNGTKSAIR